MAYDQTIPGALYAALCHIFYEGSKQFKIYPVKEPRLRKDLDTTR